MENSIEEDMKILEGIIKGDEDCINAIYSQMKVKNDNDEDIQYYKEEIQSIKNIVNNYLKEKARADKLEKEYSAMLTESDEDECDYKRVLKENEELKKELNEENKRCMMLAVEKQDYFEKYKYHLQQNESLTKAFSNVIPIQKVKDKIRHYQELQDNYIKKYDEINEGLQAMINVLQELIEQSEE